MKQVNKEVKEQRSTVTKGNSGSKGNAGLPVRPSQPTLDQSNWNLLYSRSKEFDKNLNAINVKFFPGGSMEITYEIENFKDGKSTKETLTVSGYHNRLRLEKEVNRVENDMNILKAFSVKMKKRGLIQLPEGLELDEIRKLQSNDPVMPSALRVIMNKTQEQMKTLDLNTPEGTISYWNRQSDQIKEEMDKYQELVFPDLSINWYSYLLQEQDRLVEEEKKRVETKQLKMLSSKHKEELSTPAKSIMDAIVEEENKQTSPPVSKEEEETL